MPENVNTSALACSGLNDENDHRDVMIDVDHVTMIFNMANEQLNNLKEYAIALARRELMFKEFRALDDVSFQVKRGDVFGILGTNGSGKSTVLKIIAGVLEPSKGTCTVNGNIAPLIELGAGFDMELTARENIYLNGALLGYSKKFIDEHFDEIVEFAEVGKFLDMPMKNYSSGMVARIAFAIATVIVPEILIVDEVLSVGDFMFQKKCEDRINKLIKEHGVTVLIVSHSNDQIERMCNKAVWIEKGHLRMAGTAREVCQAYRILGGHTGSAESEALVFKALERPVEPDMSRVESIIADTRYGMAAKLMERCYPDGSEKVVLVSGERDMDAFLALGLAGAMNAPVLLMQGDRVPDSTVQEIKRLKANKLLFINSGDCPEGEISKILNRALDGAELDIQEIFDTRYDSLSAKVFEYGAKRNLWCNDAVIVWVGCTGDLISLSPYIVEHCCPVFMKYREERFRDYQYAAIRRGDFKRILMLCGKVAFPESDTEEFINDGREVVRFVGNGPYHANEIIDSWMLPELGWGPGQVSLCVASVIDFGFALVLGFYAKRRKLLITLCDFSDLDATARLMRRVECAQNECDRIVFVGGAGSFGEVDKRLLAKSLMASFPEP